MKTLRETFLSELADIYDAENQLLKALPKMSEAATHQELKDAFDEHLEETETHVERLQKVFEAFGEKANTKTCKAMKGLIAEGEEVIDEDEGDAGLICAAQKVEHYEIAAYGSLHSWAELLGENSAASLLQETLQEQKAADAKLTEVADSVANLEQSSDETEHA